MKNNTFVATFWGVRGSIPTPTLPEQIEAKIRRALKLATEKDLGDDDSIDSFVSGLPVDIRSCFGGNSSCVQLDVGGERLIFDAGTGIRELGIDWMKEEFGRSQGQATLFLSHTHWDHIQGLPFFLPLYVAGNRFSIVSPTINYEERLIWQQKKEYFPVPFEAFSASIHFPDVEGKTEFKVGDISITWKENYHPNASYAFRVEYGGRSFVYATDAEYKSWNRKDLEDSISFFQGADLLIFDAQYTFGEGLEKRDWGHSSTFVGVNIAVDAGVKNIAFFHHEPTYSDSKLMEIFRQAEAYYEPLANQYALNMFLAQEGLQFDIVKNEQAYRTARDVMGVSVP